MRKGGFFPRLALSNLMRSRQFYLPYLLTVIGTGAAYYIASALAGARDLPVMTRYAYLAAFMQIGTFVIALFAVIFLTYTNSFLMKRRRRELGLYNILGLGKRHIAVMLGLETLYTAAAGIAGSIALGLLLQKLVTLLLYKIMRFDAYYGFYVSGRSIGATAILLSVILFFNLLLNLGRIHLQNPAELLREGSAGEREPRTNRPAAVLGVLCLGGGYAIAVITKSASTAMGLYFIAVFLVILGTYLLFSAVSIAVLKALRNNKRYYYQTNHFIGVSGMLYRMKRNAAGLANICILSTMVLVMISGTLSLYLNSRDAIARQFPGNMGIGVEYRPSAQSPFDSGALSTQVAAELRREKLSGSPVYGYSWLGLLAAEKNGGYQIRSSYSGSSCQLCFLTAEQYAKITGGAPEGEFSSELSLAFPGGGKMQLSVRPLSKNLPAIGGAFASTIEPKWFILKDAFDLDALYQAQAAALGSEDAASMSWYGFWNVKGEEQQLTDLPQTLEEGLAFDGTGSFERLEVQTAQAYSRDYFSLNGGFFFLGLFLGLLFIMAAVLIIYYKQVSEGYEDRERYLIMQKVGMEQRTVRASVNSQILVVFFAPLLVAGIHVAFDYNLMTRLLTLFGLYGTSITLWCTLGTFAVFALAYALVYRATARTYYKIIRAPELL